MKEDLEILASKGTPVPPGGNRFFPTPRFGIAGLLGMLIDLVLFLLFTYADITLGNAHILSFFSAAAFYYFLILHPVQKRMGKAWRPGLSFLLVTFMAVFLRGGILATATKLLDWPAALAILPAIVIGAAVTYLGTLFFSRWENEDIPCDRRWRVLAFAVVAYSFLLRLFYLGTSDLLSQEAYYWNYAQHLDIGYLDHPPMVAWVIWLMAFLLGDSVMTVRLGAFLAWLVTAFFCFRLTRDLFDSSTAFRVLLLLAVLPFFFGVGLVMTPDALLVAGWAGMLYFLERAFLGKHRSAWYGAGICAGLGMLAKYTIVLLGPAALLFMLLDRDSRHWLLKPEPYLAAILAVLLFLPVIIWNAEHQWASFVFQGSRRFRESLDFTFPALMGSLLLLLTPTGTLAALAAMRLRTRRNPGWEGIGVTHGRRERLFLALFTLLPFLFFATFSLVRNAKLNWTGPLWLAALPLIAWQMIPSKALQPSRLLTLLQRAWPPTIGITLLFFGVFLHYWVLGLPGVPYPKVGDSNLLIGWEDLGRRIELIRGEVEASTGIKPLVVGMDKCYIASQFIFYRSTHGPAAEKKDALLYTTGRHIFGMDSLMYRYWFPESRIDELRKKNSTLILVTRELHELQQDRISSSGWKMGEVQELEVKKNGVPVGRYYYALAKPQEGWLRK